MYDNCNWSVYGVEKLQEPSGRERDSTGHCGIPSQVNRRPRPQRSGIQQSGNISIDNSNNWKLEKYPEIPYILLQITIAEWDQGKCAATISQKDSRIYKIDIQTPQRAGLSIRNLEQIRPKNMKIETSALTPTNFPFRWDEYYRNASLRHVGPETD